jgi:hypothetical protein
MIMKKSMCFMVKKAGFLVITLLLSGVLTTALATPPDLEEEPDVPLDGGLSLLLAAGAALGGKKVYDMRKKAKEKND